MKQYFRYFGIWFILVVALVVLLVLTLKNYAARDGLGPNSKAPAERVYDYADVLTDQEEEKLRSQIAEAEKRLRMHIVIVTINASVEGEEAKELYGSSYWEYNMQNLADDFWDENGYGYNKSFEGDGILLLHNWYEGQNGEHLSTSGKAINRLGSYEIDLLLYEVDRYYARDVYRAYSEFVDEAVKLLDYRRVSPVYYPVALIISSVLSAFYASKCMKYNKAKDTTAANAYVPGGEPVLRSRRDNYIRKHVTHRQIPSIGSGGSGGSGSGGGGFHYSRGGAGHGGGSHRH